MRLNKTNPNWKSKAAKELPLGRLPLARRISTAANARRATARRNIASVSKLVFSATQIIVNVSTARTPLKSLRIDRKTMNSYKISKSSITILTDAVLSLIKTFMS